MKIFKISLTFGLIISIILSFARFDALCTDIRENVFRLHIIAASDSAHDQALKLKVRDAILNQTEPNFSSFNNLDDALVFAKNSTNEFKNIAESVLKENGCDYSVSVNISKSYFENRKYDNFTLPAGYYEALNIVIGEGNGKNWWCVMFPAVCIGASASLDESVSKDSCMVAENSSKYKIRFKTVEIYQDLKKLFIKTKN